MSCFDTNATHSCSLFCIKQIACHGSIVPCPGLPPLARRWSHVSAQGNCPRQSRATLFLVKAFDSLPTPRIPQTWYIQSHPERLQILLHDLLHERGHSIREGRKDGSGCLTF